MGSRSDLESVDLKCVMLSAASLAAGMLLPSAALAQCAQGCATMGFVAPATQGTSCVAPGGACFFVNPAGALAFGACTNGFFPRAGAVIIGTCTCVPPPPPPAPFTPPTPPPTVPQAQGAFIFKIQDGISAALYFDDVLKVAGREAACAQLRTLVQDLLETNAGLGRLRPIKTYSPKLMGALDHIITNWHRVGESSRSCDISFAGAKALKDLIQVKAEMVEAFVPVSSPKDAKPDH